MKLFVAVVLLFVGISAMSVAQSVTTLTDKETQSLVLANTRVQKQQANIAELQVYLAAAQTKSEAQQVTVLTDAIGHNQTFLTALQDDLTKREAAILKVHSLPVGSLFSTDFTTVTPPAPTH